MYKYILFIQAFFIYVNAEVPTCSEEYNCNSWWLGGIGSQSNWGCMSVVGGTCGDTSTWNAQGCCSGGSSFDTIQGYVDLCGESNPFCVPNVYPYKPTTKDDLQAKVNAYTDSATREETIANYGDIGTWDVSQITNMNSLFIDKTEFNEDIGSWDVSSVTDMAYMFRGAARFDQNINDWDVSSVTTMERMFNHDSTPIDFNQPLDQWDVSSVTNMNNMFRNAPFFNQDISNWAVSSVTDMRSMFRDCDRFNQDLNDWDVSSVLDLGNIFMSADDFNQKICWDIHVNAVTDNMFSGTVGGHLGSEAECLATPTTSPSASPTTSPTFSPTTTPTFSPTTSPTSIADISNKVCDCDGCCQVDVFDVYSDGYFQYTSGSGVSYTVNGNTFDHVVYMHLSSGNHPLYHYVLAVLSDDNNTPLQCEQWMASVTDTSKSFHKFVMMTTQDNTCVVNWDGLFYTPQDFANINGDMLVGFFIQSDTSSRIFITEDQDTQIVTIYESTQPSFIIMELLGLNRDEDPGSPLDITMKIRRNTFTEAECISPEYITIQFQDTGESTFQLGKNGDEIDGDTTYSRTFTAQEIDTISSNIDIENDNTALYTLDLDVIENDLFNYDGTQCNSNKPIVTLDVSHQIIVRLEIGDEYEDDDFYKLVIDVHDYDTVPCDGRMLYMAMVKTTTRITTSRSDFIIDHLGDYEEMLMDDVKLQYSEHTCSTDEETSIITCDINHISDECLPMSVIDNSRGRLVQEDEGQIECTFEYLGYVNNAFSYQYWDGEKWVNEIININTPIDTMKTFEGISCSSPILQEDVTNQVPVTVQFAIDDLQSPVTVNIAFDHLDHDSKVTLRITDVRVNILNTNFQRNFNVEDKRSLMGISSLPFYEDAHFCRYGQDESTCVPFYNEESDRWNDYCSENQDIFGVLNHGHVSCQINNERAHDQFIFTPSNWIFNRYDDISGTMRVTVTAALDDCSTDEEEEEEDNYTGDKLLSENKVRVIRKTKDFVFTPPTVSPTQSPIITPCSHTNHKTCKKDKLCLWNKRTKQCAVKPAPSPTVPPTPCSYTNQKQCRKDKSCLWDKKLKQCESKPAPSPTVPSPTVPSPTVSPTTPCSYTNQKQCKKDKACMWNKGSKQCGVKPAPAPTVPPASCDTYNSKKQCKKYKKRCKWNKNICVAK